MPQIPASTVEPTPSESHVETALKKCTGPSEDVGPTDKNSLSPINEEEIVPQRLGKELAESEERTEDETVVVEEERNLQEVNIEFQQAGHESDDSHIFSNLSDIMITPSEFFKDHASQLSSSGIEMSPIVPPLPQAKDLTPVTKAATPPKSKSGLLHNASSLHFTHT